MELNDIAAVVTGGKLLTGGGGDMFGMMLFVLTIGLIQTSFPSDGSPSFWWTRIMIGFLLLVFILLQKGLVKLSEARLSGGQARSPLTPVLASWARALSGTQT